MNIEKKLFGEVDSNTVSLYTIYSENVEVQITNFGGIITSIKVPDKTGKKSNVILGFDNLNGYLSGHPYFGAIIGRYANRIAEGQFSLNNNPYKLTLNNGPNHLHGGQKGFDKVVWDEARQFVTDITAGISLQYLSKNMEENYPGNLNVQVTYTLNNKNELKIDYRGATDETTIINLTNHIYFNLKNGGSDLILNHELLINADKFTPVNETLIPTCDILNVENTPFDFRKLKKIGRDIEANDAQLKIANGYDHNFVLNKKDNYLSMACLVNEFTSGRGMEVWTTEPGVQFYTGNYLDGTITGKNNNIYNFRNGFCLETQHFPNSPNCPDFPSVVLEPGVDFVSTTIYKFGLINHQDSENSQLL